MKRLARDALTHPLEDGLELERQEAAAHLMSADVAEGLRAFEERRTPTFL
jgi:enoyl-CoA hydratase/carnithine racemase